MLPLDNTYKIVNRSLGAGQLVLGSMGVAGSAALAPMCVTGVGCALSAVAGTISADAAYADAKQLVSGEQTNTFLKQGLQSLGLSPEAAGLVEVVLGVGAAVKATSAINKAIDQTVELNAAAKATYGAGATEGISTGNQIGILRDAATAKGNFGLGQATAAEADTLATVLKVKGM